MGIRIFTEEEIRKSVTLPEAIGAIESAFVSYSEKGATVPAVVHLDVPEHRGEVHIKAAHIHRAGDFVVKVAAGFYANRLRNIPVGSGLMLVFSAETGYPQAILLDQGYLTDLRTAVAGAVAAKYMAIEQVDQAAILGAGVQGRFQLEALLCVRQIKRALIYDHHPINVANYLADMERRVEIELFPAESVAEAARGSRIIVTATPSRKPFVKAEWIEPGTHITAVGSDGPDKQELEPELLVRADHLIADSVIQALQLGEIHHAVAGGFIKEEDIDGELGDVIRRRIPGRLNNQEITICDLTGVGVQDAAIAQLVYQNAMAMGFGREL